jgi:hypothetical protein
VRIGDNDVALGHDLVVSALQAGALVIGAVIGGDEWHARAAGGDHRAPGGCAATGVDEVDRFVGDHAADQMRVPQQTGRVFGCRGERDELAA